MCVCACALHRLEEIPSPSKKLPPESTPRVIFTGFEPTQVQQYTKVNCRFFLQFTVNYFLGGSGDKRLYLGQDIGCPSRQLAAPCRLPFGGKQIFARVANPEPSLGISAGAKTTEPLFRARTYTSNRCRRPLPQRLHALGGEVAEGGLKVTHLVASKVKRTVKFLAAMSVAKHVVTPEWLEESWRTQKFVGMSVPT